MPFQPSFNPPEQPPASARWFIFQGDNLIIRDRDPIPSAPEYTSDDLDALGVHSRQYLCELSGTHCYTGMIDDATVVDERYGSLQPTRLLYRKPPDALFCALPIARHLTYWDRNSRFCGRCGAPNTFSATERAKVCTACGFTAYPRISPAVIVAVVKDNKLLLGRSNRFPGRMYSVLAGFVEPGETLEACVAREVKEEAGIEVTDIRYFASQPWPFPDTLMVGFTATYAGGEICVDRDELSEAGWFAANELPETPVGHSVSRALIDWFVTCHGA